MKTTILILLCLIFGMTWAQEPTTKEIKTEVSEVTVFINGAQVTRKKSVDVTPGKTMLKFVNLSPFIDAKSVQVKADGEITVLSVNHQQNFLDKLAKSKELTDLENQFKGLEDQLELENTYISIIQSELSFLESNKTIGGKTQELNVATLKEASVFYSTRLKELKLQEIDRNKTITQLLKKRNEIQNQMNTLVTQKEYPTGEIMVSIESKKSTRASFEVSYLVENAGWFPTYDIRAKDISQPVELAYKANVKQDTKEDWNNVKLTFSSSDPNRTGVAPELQTYYLGYNMRPPVYNKRSNTVTGKVLDSNRAPLPGATVMVEGSTIGTVCDMEGNYSITLPSQSSQLVFSFIGCISKTMMPVNSVLNVVLEENASKLEEVVAVGYGVRNDMDFSSALAGSVAGVSVEKKGIKIRGMSSSIPVPSIQIEKQTTVSFEIKTPYTIPSDNKNYTVDMDLYNLPADYQYYCVPKIDPDAFLIANITNWEQYNLIEGEANIFFEGTYVGKTLLNLQNATDTLQLSLGRDKQVSVTREKIKDYTTKQLIGNKKEETRAWKTTVKNNKSQPVHLILLDQIPVSTLEEIEVTVQKTTNGKQDEETGEMKWEIKLEPTARQEVELRYSVKYPKNKSIIIE